MRNDYTLFQYILLLIGIILIFIFFVNIMLLFYNKNYMNNKMIRRMFILYIIGFTILGFLFEPDITYDLYRHFQWMDDIRNSDYTLIQLNLQAIMFKQEVGYYPKMMIFNLMRNNLVFITTNNHYLPLICTFICYVIFSYIVVDYFKAKAIKNNHILLCVVVFMSLLPIIMVTSGIRNSLAFSFVSLGIYKWLYKNKSIISFSFYSILGIFIHITAIIPILIAIFSKIFRNKKSAILIILIFIFFNPLLILLKSINLDFLSDLIERFFYFNEESKYQGEKFCYIICIITCLILILNFKDTKECLDMFVFYYLIILLCSSLLESTAFLTRMSYIVAYMSPIFLSSILEKKNVNIFYKCNYAVLLIISIINIAVYIYPFVAALI